MLNVHDIELRNNTDNLSNKHGSQFIEFLETKMCILNGCNFKENDKFTSISVKGKSVVDYISVPHSNL